MKSAGQKEAIQRETTQAAQPANPYAAQPACRKASAWTI
jgi:hypothetical protein